jgi:NTE family protein
VNDWGNGACAGLFMPGGGARGAYQAGALKAIAEIVRGARNPFPVITGASVGAVNAAALAAQARDFQNAVAGLAAFWQDMHADEVYRTDMATVALRGLHWVVTMTPLGEFGVNPPRSLLDNAPLKNLLRQRIDFAGIGAAIRSGDLRALAITASSYDRAIAVTFVQGAGQLEGWTRARQIGVGAKISVGHLLASSALPFVFPAQRVGNEYYGDGSLRLTAPLSPAIHAGADRILVIGVRDLEQYAEPAPGTVSYPSLGAISGYLLDTIFMDNLDADIERAERVNHTVSLVAPDKRGETELRKVSILSLQPSCDLRDIAREHGEEMPWTIRMLLRRLGVWGNDWRLPSYLLFEPGYCRALVELGYRDTLARRDEVAAFLAPPVAQPRVVGGQALA